MNNRFAVQGLVYSLDNYQVHLDRQLISRSRLAYETVKSAVLDYLNNLEGIAYAVDMEKVAISTLPTGIREKIITGIFSGKLYTCKSIGNGFISMTNLINMQ